VSTVGICEPNLFGPGHEQAENLDNNSMTEKSGRIAGWLRVSVSIVTTILGISMLLNQILSSANY